MSRLTQKSGLLIITLQARICNSSTKASSDSFNFLSMAIKLCQEVGFIVTTLKDDAQVPQQILVCYFSTTEVKLKFNLTAGVVQCLFFNELDSHFVIQLPVLYISKDVLSAGPEDELCISKISTAQLGNFGLPHSPELLRCLGRRCSRKFSCYSGCVLCTTKIGW